MYKLVARAQFSAAHRLDYYPGACERLHGHNWQVRATIAGAELDKLGMVLDLMVFKTLLEECLQVFDHRLINEVAPFDTMNPTSENLARYIFEWMKNNLPAKAGIVEVEVAENDEFSVRYSET
ncbi:MAG TPA: 6-carboxytetrahydropterin synthase QueD [bacterium]|nr:6-carboxytetrahydropterin synthase QueD [bacterium]HPR88561.1 6-carboxytetrahydropterin synthase QueD [bacterium]